MFGDFRRGQLSNELEEWLFEIPWISNVHLKGKNSAMFIPTLPETNSSHLKMDGWNTRPSFWDGLFSGAMLVSGRVRANCSLLNFFLVIIPDGS